MFSEKYFEYGKTLSGELEAWSDKELEKYFPPKALHDELQGEVITTFVISKEGTIENITVVKSVGPELDQEAMRVIEIMPQWFPGMQGGKFVAVQYTLPIKFTLR